MKKNWADQLPGTSLSKEKITTNLGLSSISSEQRRFKYQTAPTLHASGIARLFKEKTEKIMLWKFDA